MQVAGFAKKAITKVEITVKGINPKIYVSAIFEEKIFKELTEV